MLFGRRLFLSSALGLAAQTGSAGAHASNPAQPSETLTFVLVHGAWHGGWCWQRVARLLEAQGHIVHAPTLTGLCERSHLLSPAINLTTHINDICGEIEWKDLTQVVLCGHSYGGMVITGVAERLASRLRAVVYLDALVPEDGQSAADVSGRPIVGEFVTPFPAEAFVNQADAAWVQAKMTLQPAETLRERLTQTGAVSRIERRTYIRAGLNTSPTFARVAARLGAAGGWRLLEIEAMHDAMLDAPAELASMLVQAA